MPKTKNDYNAIPAEVDGHWVKRFFKDFYNAKVGIRGWAPANDWCQVTTPGKREDGKMNYPFSFPTPLLQLMCQYASGNPDSEQISYGNVMGCIVGLKREHWMGIFERVAMNPEAFGCVEGAPQTEDTSKDFHPHMFRFAPPGCKFKRRDSVTFTNDNGVSFEDLRVTGFVSHDPTNGRIVYLDTDCHWFPKKISSLKNTNS